MKKLLLIFAIALALVLALSLFSCGSGNEDECQHEVAIDEAIPATCITTGLTEGSHCSVCGKVIVAQEEVPETEEHTPVTDEAIPATCKEVGWSEGSHCGVCNIVLVSPTPLPKSKEHSIVTLAAVAPTCKDEGLTAGSKCKVCNKVVVAQTAVPETNNHKFVQTQDYLSFKCSSCGLKVIEHGNADGSMSGGNDKVKYYVTGDTDLGRFEIVVYGTGAMPDFSKTEHPMWYDYLGRAVRVSVKEGITSIGKYAFYCPEPATNCQFEMANSVKTIKTGGIYLNVENLVLGDGVETLEADAIGDISSIYIPKSVKNLNFDILGNETYFYEGTLQEFYQIKLRVYNRSITVKEFIDALDEAFLENIHVYLQAENISDRSHYWR